jgi:uncharacterized protein (DUF1778 family)
MLNIKAGREIRRATINLRASNRQRSLIDLAAHTLGKNRSDFMLEAACREANAVLLDRRYFMLEQPVFQKFMKALDKPPTENVRLRRLLLTKSPWDK